MNETSKQKDEENGGGSGGMFSLFSIMFMSHNISYFSIFLHNPSPI